VSGYGELVSTLVRKKHLESAPDISQHKSFRRDEIIDLRRSLDCFGVLNQGKNICHAISAALSRWSTYPTGESPSRWIVSLEVGHPHWTTE
jgi:hypothetical protein